MHTDKAARSNSSRMKFILYIYFNEKSEIVRNDAVEALSGAFCH